MSIDFYAGPPEAPDTYRLVRQLGAGGEGEVWTAVQQLSERGRRTVAVKVTTATGDPDEAERWAETGHLLRALSHPGLVRVTDVFLGGDVHRAGERATGTSAYVVMDYVEGTTLTDWIIEHPAETAAARLRMLLTVASALDDMHAGRRTELPVAHGDVKPGNIVVRPEGGTVLVDLGLIRLVDAVGRMGRSRPYAAPELRVEGAQATPEADRYAFAVTVTQVLTGRPPPLRTDGWLDEVALQELLRTHPTTSRRHVLVRRLVEAVTAPPEARPRNLARWLSASLESLSQVTDGDDAPGPPAVEVVAPPPPPPPPPPVRGHQETVRPFGFYAVVAALSTMLAALVAALLPAPQPTAPRVAGPPTAVAAAPATIASVATYASRPPRDRYGCAALTALPTTVPLPPTNPAAPVPPGVTYDADSFGPTAQPFQLHVGGYLDQAFVALHPTVSAVAAVPGIDFRVGPEEARLQYELWDLDGHQLGPTLTVHVDASNVNGSVAGEFAPPVTLQPGRVYVLRVTNVDATPAIGIYIRSPTGQQVASPMPVCLVDADPRTGPRAVLHRQGAVLSGRIGSDG